MTDQNATAAPLVASTVLAPLDRPRIYVACLAAYNNGCLHGAWIDATTPDEIWEQVRAMLAASPTPEAEEYAIHDYEGFEGASLSEYASFETVCDLADFIAEYCELGERTEIPESLCYYIDWQALARDMALNGEIMVFQMGFDEVHVFWSR